MECARTRHWGRQQTLQKELQGWDPKKSRNLIAVLCCFCGWIDFGCFVRFRVGVAVNGDVAQPGLRNAGNGDVAPPR